MENVIETSNLTKIYGKGIVAVDHVNLQVKRGEVFGLLGPNGAGKTTVIRMLATFARPTYGTELVGGYDIVREAQRVREIVGYSLQEAGLDENATGRENLELFGRYYHLSREKIERRIEDLLKLVGLTDVADRLVRTYSSGMKKRLEIATALIHEPKILFLDEPTLGLDVQARIEIWSYIREINREGATVILTTHYLEEADKLCSRVAIMDHGRIIAIGAPEDLKKRVKGDSISLSFSVEDIEAFKESIARARVLLQDRPFVEEVKPVGRRLLAYVRDAESAIPQILHALQNAGIGVESVTLSKPSLDDVFLMYTGRTIRGEAE